MKSARRLSKEQADAIAQYVTSDEFLLGGRRRLGVSAIPDDEEAMAFAKDFLTLFQACDVDVFPTRGGTSPNLATMVGVDTGMLLALSNSQYETTDEIKAWWSLCSLLKELGMEIRLGGNEAEDRAVLCILKNPALKYN